MFNVSGWENVPEARRLSPTVVVLREKARGGSRFAGTRVAGTGSFVPREAAS
jgi:hypothetical protein